MKPTETGQVAHSAAEVYETFFLPALFTQWTDRVLDAAGVRPGHQVLDVACGTGVLARAAAAWVGPDGAVVGLDLNPGMLAVARREAPDISWREGRAEALPFPDAHFDAVVSQFGLMFFADQVGALREMARVLRPGGRLAVAVWDTLANTPGYDVMVELLDRLFGPEAAKGLRAPYVLGDVPALHALFAAAGMPDATITTHPGTARYPSIADWVYTDIKGWTLAEMIDDAQYERLLAEAKATLQPFVTADGAVAFPAPAHIVAASRPRSRVVK